MKILPPCHGLKEINRREIIVDACNTLRGSCKLTSRSSSLPLLPYPSLPLLLHHLLLPDLALSSAAPWSGTVASPSMLSPVWRGQKNAGIGPILIGSHVIPLEYYTLSLCVHVCAHMAAVHHAEEPPRVEKMAAAERVDAVAFECSPLRTRRSRSRVATHTPCMLARVQKRYTICTRTYSNRGVGDLAKKIMSRSI